MLMSTMAHMNSARLAMLNEVKENPCGYSSTSSPKVNGLYSGLGPTLRPTLVEIRSVGFVQILPTNKQTQVKT